MKIKRAPLVIALLALAGCAIGKPMDNRYFDYRHLTNLTELNLVGMPTPERYVFVDYFRKLKITTLSDGEEAIVLEYPLSPGDHQRAATLRYALHVCRQKTNNNNSTFGLFHETRDTNGGGTLYIRCARPNLLHPGLWQYAYPQTP